MKLPYMERPEHVKKQQQKFALFHSQSEDRCDIGKGLWLDWSFRTFSHDTKTSTRLLRVFV